MALVPLKWAEALPLKAQGLATAHSPVSGWLAVKPPPLKVSVPLPGFRLPPKAPRLVIVGLLPPGSVVPPV